ncbi:hypothetical protein F4801DRAFT_77634 [Xylaria longipes]|nr:hypothetical protein F4801DRAFT_77634 [Xylaria longipes]RYC58448.1 hypothetical protein CHU98_g7766 [Xylaria longipes]
MYSRDEICNAVLKFYRQILRHPYLDDDTLTIPPPQGWSSINNTAGKDETVIDLLRHLPYLSRNSPSSGQLLIYPGTIPICYQGREEQHREQEYPLPPHCVYLARREDYLGRDLILDTSNGAVTEFASDNTSVPYDEYEALPDAEKWRVHRTVPLTELLDVWTRMYEELRCMVAPNPIGQPVTGRFYSRSDDTTHGDVDYEGGSELDREQGNTMRREREHAAKVYNAYIRHGWPDHFDKERCRIELLDLERAKDAEEKRLMDENNPDAALFD